MDPLRRHGLAVSILPLADWRIVRLRMTHVSGSLRRDSNLLAHERARLDARFTDLIWPAPLVLLLGLFCSAFRAKSLVVTIEAAEVLENGVPVDSQGPDLDRVLPAS